MLIISKKIWSISVLFLLALTLLACSRDAANPDELITSSEQLQEIPLEIQRETSLLLVTVDTWRWDYIGASGSGKVATPVLDALAESGLYAQEVLTPCPLTTPAHASLFTGLYPLTHGVLDCTSYTLRDEFPLLAEAFQDEGYRTAAFISSDTLNSKYGLHRGFQVYAESGIKRRDRSDWMPPTKDGVLTTEEAVSHLRSLAQDSPAFVWVHYFDLHTPYRRRPQYDQKYPGDPYAAQAAFVDDQVAILQEELKKHNDRKWVTIIVGDHGEGLGDHGEIGHGYGLYRSTLHVPLIIHPVPELLVKLPKPWSLVDLNPTIREMFDLPQESESEGDSLFHEGDPERYIPSLSFLPSFIFRVNPTLGMRQGDWMYIRHGAHELFNMSEDPDQLNNLAAGTPSADASSRLRRKTSELFSREKVNGIVTPTLQQTEENLMALQSLGYLAGGSADMSKLQRADLQTLLKDYNKMEEVREESYLSKDNRPLLKQYRKLLTKYPKSATLYKNFGKMLLKSRNYGEALSVLEKAVKLDPQDRDSIVNLGTLFIKSGQYERARTLLESAIRMDPDDAKGHKNLAILCGDFLKDRDVAVQHYKIYLELVPDSPDRERIVSYISGDGLQP